MGSNRIVVVGGGVIGLSIAYHLNEKKLRPIVLEKSAFAREASWAGAGFLDLRSASRVDSDFFSFCKMSFDLFPSWCDKLKKESGVDPEFSRSGSLDLAFTREEEESIRALKKSMADFGETGQELTRKEALNLEPALSPHVRSAFFVEGTSQIRPPRLGRALSAYLQKSGVSLRDKEPVEDFLFQGNKVKGVRTSRGEIEADQVVLTAGPWSGALCEKLGFTVPTRPIRGQAVIFKDDPGRVRHILFTGLGKAFVYMVPRLDGHLYIGSTLEDVGFDKNVTPEGEEKLERGARFLCPHLAPYQMESHWAGLRTGSVDGWPYLGRIPGLENVWLATGHFTHGLLQSAVSGRLMAQALIGAKTDLSLEPFAPGRIPHAAAGL
jgi:glycine oxidase